MKPTSSHEGILLVNKPRGLRSFTLVSMLRRHLNVKTIGHAGTLDPFATGVMVMLIGKKYTRLSHTFLNADKAYNAKVELGKATDSYDCDGAVTATSDLIPSLSDVEAAISLFQGEIDQVPPMFSAKKRGGKKLYELAREGKTIDLEPVKVVVTTKLISYTYPYIELSVTCSKGTYIRSIAHELGEKLGCGAHLAELVRTRSGNFELKDCLDGTLLQDSNITPSAISSNLRTQS